jgi:uroporphyrinogen decarboxylase
MTSKERFIATIERRQVDRPASWLGLPVAEAEDNLFNYFKVDNITALKQKIGDDLWPVEVPYNHPPSNHIACAFDFAVNDENDDYEERTLTSQGFFADIEDPQAVNDFNWPDPKTHISAEQCRAAINAVPDNYATLGVMWSAHFQDTCAAFGMENAMMVMLTAPEMYQAVIDRIVEFYLEANAIFYDAVKDRLDAVLIGNDFGSQQALMVSPELLKTFVLPGTKRLVEQAKDYGFKVIHHSCGAIREIIPELIEIGCDAIHPIQALAAGMEPSGLKCDFGSNVSFCGGVDVQDLLVNGTPDEVIAKVKELTQLFPTGLIISPSHEAILDDVPPKNIEAMFKAI